MDGGGEEVFTDGEGQMLPYSARKRGGWATFPFIAGALIGSSIAASGWANNLIVYMIEKFHVRSIDATQTFNIVAASTSLLPMVAAILADSFLGCFSIVWISSLISILGIILIALTAMLDPLWPQPCQHGSTSCPTPSKVQFCILYSGIALAAVGVAGTRFTIAAIGANQFDNSKDQRVFFNWFAISLYTSMVLGATVIVYIEENVSWVFGYWLCVAVNVIGLVVFLSGKRYYRHIKPQGSPFLSLAHVVVATIVKRKVPLSSRAEDYYHKEDGPKEKPVSLPSKSFRFLNHAAAMEAEEDSKVNSWRLCSVQQVEDFKNLLRIFPLLSSGVLMCTTLPVISTLTILQTLTVDRHLGPDMKVPAGSMIVFILTSTAINLTLIDWFLFPLWKKITLRSPMPLHRIGLGHLFNMTGMAVASLVESRRLKLAQTHSVLDHPGSVVPMFVLWLVPQLVLGQVTLYYQEFPQPLRSTAAAMISVVVGFAYYLSTTVIDLVRRVTTWLPDDINNGRLGNVYSMFAMMQMLNFFYFLFCAKCYKYHSVEGGNKNSDDESSKS
ncbi:hypothetical protein E1A91_D08G012200v1 [Gossypium mustelinum]|uniref:Major facilitator superfamily (MFS) profile domain-containing protein n=1 Tax=Gossypium mustelinum TaxID=34275 RepID=A0A5D2TQ87_GOSMU|nr:hypothetical protein E1A91_D08G012200v1 [Gossypium mustelinum]